MEEFGFDWAQYNYGFGAEHETLFSVMHTGELYQGVPATERTPQAKEFLRWYTLNQH
jgi:hypothetical protein